MSAVLAFSVKTIPDVAGLRLLQHLSEKMSDADVLEHVAQQRRARCGDDFLPLHCRRVVAISCVLYAQERLCVFSLTAPDLGEAGVLQGFFDEIEKTRPQLVGWNARAVDLPVLHYRGLIHAVQAGQYWNSECLDLAEKLAGDSLKAGGASVSDLAKLMGVSSPEPMTESQVWQAYLAGDVAQIVRDTEECALNIYNLYLRYQLMSGAMDKEVYESESLLADRADWFEANF